jgi:tripartite-type tricarboxylate transporter receptor subunit TctC
MSRISKRSFVLASLALLAGGVMAQGFPDRPLKLVIPYAPGGPTDVLGRAVAEHLGRVLKQSVVVENRAGAGGIVAMTAVAKAPADGYTLLLGDMNLAVGGALHKSLPYDPVKDFTPIGMIATAPMLMLVPPDSTARTAEEYVTMAKATPGKLSYASAGIGSPTHLAAEVLKTRYGLDITHVPYSGSGPALTAVAAGHASLIFTGLSGARPLIDCAKLRPLAITGDKRSAALPNVPTLQEAGVTLPELSVGSWWGLLGPAGMPPAVTDQLGRALRSALATPEMKERLNALNFTQPAADTDFRRWVANEARTWTAVLQRAGIRPE